MTNLLSISSAYSYVPSHNYETADFKAIITHGFNVQTTDYDMINKYIIHKLNQYTAANTENFSLWTCIQVDFEKFEAQHFVKLYGSTWNMIMHYCYPYGYWIDKRISAGRTQTTAMLKAIAIK